MPVFEAGVSKQKAMILSLTPFVHLLQNHCSHVFCQSNPSLLGPQENSASSSPVRRARWGSSVFAREGREEFFRPNADQPLRDLLVPQFQIFSAAFFSPRNSPFLMNPALRDRHAPNVHSKNF
ncbi:hypothetical protein GWK47_014919 [Chionoecetes opilio]|uniref:Uncharacterized protein n=1 Tax=Chionoecetes opilio TaxID=41210 RepID=A0A8J4Y3C5_CHIOP|nr:hypothetical protein GWK47_014919 [Chionoecetes opilio]